MKRGESGVRGVFWRANPRGSQERKRSGGGRERGEWWIRWVCCHGHIHREQIGPKSLAVQHYGQRKVQTRTEGYCPQRGGTPKPALFDDALKDFLAYGRANKRSWKDDLRRSARLQADFGGRLLDDLTPKDVEAWKATLAEEGRRPATVNRYLALFKSVCAMAVRNRRAKDTPARGVKLFHENNCRLRYLSDEEEPVLMAVLSEDLKLLVRFAILTGLRWGEQVGLTWDRVDYRSHTLTVPRSKHGEARSIPLSSEAQAILHRILRRLGGSWVFLQPNGEPYRETPRGWDIARQAAGLVDFRWHDLRHTFASRLVMAGVDLNTARELLGHKTLTMTLRYAHLAPSHLRQAVEVLTVGGSGTGMRTDAKGSPHAAGSLAP